MTIPIGQIIEIAKHGLVSSATSFEAIANGRVPMTAWGADRMPEAWILASMMRAAHDNQFAAIPEVRIRHDMPWFTTGQGEAERRLEPDDFPALRDAGAKIDLILGEESAIPDCTRVRLAMEIKGPKANWDAFARDLHRLQHLRQVINRQDEAVVFAYVTCPLTPAQQAAELATACRLMQLQPQDFVVVPALRFSVYANNQQPDVRSYVFLHVLP